MKEWKVRRGDVVMVSCRGKNRTRTFESPLQNFKSPMSVVESDAKERRKWHIWKVSSFLEGWDLGLGIVALLWKG